MKAVARIYIWRTWQQVAWKKRTYVADFHKRSRRDSTQQWEWRVVRQTRNHLY